MDISIIILSYNTRELLRQCLECTLNNLGGLSGEVIVVDNASTDRSPEMVETAFPGVRLVKNHTNLGYAGGNNTGILNARSPLVLLLNSDAFLGGKALFGMVEYFWQHPRVGILGPRLVHADGSLHLSCRYFPSLGRHFARVTAMHRFLPFRHFREWDWMTDFAHDQPRRVEMISGACWMFRRSMLDEIGLLNDQLFLYGEEFDLCWRAAKAGWETWFVPVGPIVHLGGKSTPGNGGTNVVTSYHRYRSDYLTMRWHRGLIQACMMVGMDQAVLRWRLLKNRILHSDDMDILNALTTAIVHSRQAAGEIFR